MTTFQWIITGLVAIIMLMAVTLTVDNAKQNSEDKARDQLCQVMPSSSKCW